MAFLRDLGHFFAKKWGFQPIFLQNEEVKTDILRFFCKINGGQL